MNYLISTAKIFRSLSLFSLLGFSLLNWVAMGQTATFTMQTIDPNPASNGAPNYWETNFEKSIDYFTDSTYNNPSIFLGSRNGGHLYDLVTGAVNTVNPGGLHYERSKPFYFTNGGWKFPDIIASVNGVLVWYQNPLNRGQSESTVWNLDVIGGNAGCHDLYVLDLDGDGLSDVACSATFNFGTGAFVIFQNSGGSWSSAITPYPAGDGIAPIAINGVNGGARNNIVACNGSTLYWYQNPGGAAARTASWTAHSIGGCNNGVSIGTLNVPGPGGARDIVIVASNEQEPTAWAPGLVYYDPGGGNNPTSWAAVTIDNTWTDVHQINSGTLSGVPYMVVAEQEQASKICNGLNYNDHPSITGCRVDVFPWNTSTGGFNTPTQLSNLGTQNQQILQVGATAWMTGANHCEFACVDPALHLWKFNFGGTVAPTPGVVNCINKTPNDSAALQTAANAGGHIQVTGTCNLSAPTDGVNVNVAGTTFDGGGIAKIVLDGVLYYPNTAFVVNAQNTTIENFDISRGTAAYVPGNGITQFYGFNFLSNSVHDTNSGFALLFEQIMRQSNISNNSFTMIAPDGFKSATYASLGFPQCYNNGTNCENTGGTAIQGLSAWDTSTINNNTFDYIISDGMHLGWNTQNDDRYHFNATNVSISYNVLTHVHRIGLELQGDTNYIQCNSPGNPVGCSDLTLGPTITGLKLAGNYFHDPFLTWTQTYAYSFVHGGSASHINNGGLMNAGGVAEPRPGYCIETGGGDILTQGNVCGADNLNPGPPLGWDPNIAYGGNPTDRTYTYTAQNNILCTDQELLDDFAPEGPGLTTIYVTQYNYRAQNCPNPTTLTTSAITLAFTGSSITSQSANTTFQTPTSVGAAISGQVQTFSWTVRSNLPIKYAIYYLDGDSDDYLPQEIQDVNTNFQNDLLWHYHVSIPLGGVTGTHTIQIVVTDLNGTTASNTQSFTPSSTGPGTVVLTPTTPSAIVGGSPLQISATGCGTGCTFALASGSVGTLTGASSTAVNYQPPSSVVPQTSALGCPVAPNDSVFATRVDNAPIESSSASWLGAGNSSALGISFLPSWGFAQATNASPTVNIIPYYGDGNSLQPVYQTPWPGRAFLQRENGNYTSGALTNNDHHSIIVNTTSCKFYEIYNDTISLTGADLSYTRACRYSGTNCNASSAIPPYISANFTRPNTTTDAAGLPLAPLTWTLADIKAGPKHMARFTTGIGYINGFEWPAIQGNASHSGSPPYGGVWRLKSTFNTSAVCGSNNDCTNILVGLQHYGMMLADIGTNNNIILSADTATDTSVRAALALIQAANIGPSNFDIVDIDDTWQETTANGWQLPTGGSYAVDPSNGTQVPAGFAELIATPSTGSPTKLSIAVEGVGIGLPASAIAIQAGMSAYSLPSWVTPGTANQSVTWALTSGVGSVSNNTYTPPNTTGNAILTATAVADPNVHATLYVTVLATNTSPATGTIRIDIDSATSTTDGAGQTWNPDNGCVWASTPNFASADYPQWQKPWGTNILEYLQYGTQVYTYGGDINCRVVLPNGGYSVRVMQGKIWNGSNWPQGSFAQTLLSSPEFIDVNGTIVAHYVDWNYQSGQQWATPADTFVPAFVTNNVLSVGVHALLPDQAVTVTDGIGPYYGGAFPNLYNPTLDSSPFKSSVLNGIEIIPSTTYWYIDTQGAKTLGSGGYLQLWFVDPSDGTAPNWSVQGPVGIAINGSGLLSFAAPGSYLNGQPITVTATGKNHSTTVVLYTSGGTGYFIN